MLEFVLIYQMFDEKGNQKQNIESKETASDIFQEKVHTYRLWQVIFQTLIWEMLLIYVVDMNFS